MPLDRQSDSWRWADLLLLRDEVEGRRVLERMVEWYVENDGRADDFGRLRIVIDAQRALTGDDEDYPERAYGN